MTDDIFTPLLIKSDWNDEWMRLQLARERGYDSATWDARAKTYPVKHGSQQGYVELFLKLAAIRDGETVLDMGCGTGALATPLAATGHRVIACDFSQGMMDVMLADQADLGVTGVETHLMSWEDDWSSHGLGAGCADVAIASRSIATTNLRESLLKLDRAARRRACITLSSGPSPKSDPVLLAAAGFDEHIGRDFLYAFNILAQCGIMPEVAYIPNTRMEIFPTFDDVLEAYVEIVEGAMKGVASADELANVPNRLRPWLEQNLVEDEQGVHLAEPRKVTWAFIAWNKA